MNFRTDLALEQREALGERTPPGVSAEELSLGQVKISRIKVETAQGEKALQKPVGNYITIEVPPFSDNAHEIDERLEALSRELSLLLPKEGLILVVGLGNSEITPDALGPKTAGRVLATRHITGEIARSAGLDDLRPVAVITPGVLGQTGVETGEIIRGLVEHIKPAGVIVVDALASRNLSRLGCTVQISDTGISPGSGVGNSRAEISKKTLGVPVIAVGVPTVVDAFTLANDLMQDENGAQRDRVNSTVRPRGAEMIVTPREIDLLIDRAAGLVSLGINHALQPQIPPEDMLALAS